MWGRGGGANSPPVKGEWREAARGFRSKPRFRPMKTPMGHPPLLMYHVAQATQRNESRWKC